jgi:hypothetical protein
MRAILLAALAASPAKAGEADVEAVRIEPEPSDAFTIRVTVRHADEGWDHYADRWEVRAADGGVLGERILLHPHGTEQPFARSQSGIVVPAGVNEVVVRAHDTVHKWGGRDLRIAIPAR